MKVKIMQYIFKKNEKMEKNKSKYFLIQIYLILTDKVELRKT